MKIDKNFKKWGDLKSDLQELDSKIFFREGEIWWCHLGVNLGFEQDGKGERFERPVLVSKKFNNDVFIGLPISSKIKDNKFYFNFKFKNEEYSILLSQVRLLDKKRLIRKLGVLEYEKVNEIKVKLENLLKTKPPVKGGISEA